MVCASPKLDDLARAGILERLLHAIFSGVGSALQDSFRLLPSCVDLGFVFVDRFLERLAEFRHPVRQANADSQCT
jgi:hypothetical protein